MAIIGPPFLKILIQWSENASHVKFFRKMKKETMPLQPITIEEPFTQWGLYVIGPINPKSSKGHSYILTATDYFTKWKEAIALKKVDYEELINFP
jgi:hypothetical protein